MGKKKKYNSRLNTAIAESGLKKRWLAEQIGVHPSMITYWITGERLPVRWQRLHMAELLHCTVEDIF